MFFENALDLKSTKTMQSAITRKSLRMPGYDYRLSGYYYVTLCTGNRQCLFGEVIGGEMRLNGAGKMVQEMWIDIPNHYDGFDIDDFVVMPNHLHGILVRQVSLGTAQGSTPPFSLFELMRNFKSITTLFYMRGVGQGRFKPFEKKLWQRSYYEHVIRNDDGLGRIRKYIMDNPSKWDEDRENPFWLPKINHTQDL